MSESFYWYDLETRNQSKVGSYSVCGVRTDTELNIIDDPKPFMFDYLTMSCLILKHH